MEIILKGEAKEIAALILELQERHNKTETKNETLEGIVPRNCSLPQLRGAP